MQCVVSTWFLVLKMVNTLLRFFSMLPQIIAQITESSAQRHRDLREGIPQLQYSLTVKKEGFFKCTFILFRELN